MLVLKKSLLAGTPLAPEQLPNGLRFAAHVPVYAGGCVGVFRLQVKPGVFSPKAPMLWVHGDADDYTPIGACRDYAERIGKAGTPVEFVTIEGAMHKFDQDDTRRVDLRGAQRTLETCPLLLRVLDGAASFEEGSGGYGYNATYIGGMPGASFQPNFSAAERSAWSISAMK